MNKAIFLQTLTLATLILFPPRLCAGSIDFTYEATTNTSWSDIWSIVVFDGTNLVLSSEVGSEGGAIKCAKYDLALNQISSAATVASTNDTAGHDSIADHKHVFQATNHYITFSISGSTSSGGYLYLTKFDRDFNRIDIITVVSNSPPTNDMMMFGDGTNRLFVGNFNPGTGHDFYVYDNDLTLLTNYSIGGMGPDYDDRHSNGSAGIFYSNLCHLAVQTHMGATNNTSFYHIAFDPDDGTVTNHAEVILTDPKQLSLITGLSHDIENHLFLCTYMRVTNSAASDGGSLYTLILDNDWEYAGNRLALVGYYHRPHNLIVSNKLFLSYDGGSPGVQLSSFFIGRVRPMTKLLEYDFQTSGGVFETTPQWSTNLITSSAITTQSGSPLDMPGIDGRGCANTNWNTASTNAFFTFTVVVTANYAMAAMELSFADLSPSGGPTNWEMRTSFDDYATITAAGTTHTSWTTNTAIMGLSNLIETNEFRLFAFHATAATQYWTIDNLQIKGYMERADSADDDNDGIPNGWEYYHTGTTTNLTATGDDDGDGVTNYFEYITDTIPFHNEDYFALESISSISTNTIAMNMQHTSNKRLYSILHTDTLTGSVVWTESTTAVPGNGGYLTLIDTNVPDHRFYKIKINVPE